MGMTLVTGAAGFIGAHVCAALARAGRSVRGLVHKGGRDVEGLRELGVEIIAGDLLDKDSLRRALDGVDRVHHLAAAVRPKRWAYVGRGLADEFERANLEGTRNLAELACGTVSSFLFYSSVAAGGIGPRMDEARQLKPPSEYARSKRRAEEHLLGLARAGFPAKILRPGWVYGPGNVDMAIVFKLLGLGVFPSFGAGRNSRPFIYIENLVRAALLVEQQGKGGETYFAVDEPVTLERFFSACAQCLGRRPPRFYLPDWLLFGGLRVKEALERATSARLCPLRIDVTLKTARLACADWVCSNEKLKGLGFQAGVGLEEGLGRTLNWYRARGLA